MGKSSSPGCSPAWRCRSGRSASPGRPWTTSSCRTRGRRSGTPRPRTRCGRSSRRSEPGGEDRSHGHRNPYQGARHAERGRTGSAARRYDPARPARGEDRVAAFQGIIVLALAGAVGVPYSPTLLVTLVAELLLLSFTLTAIGVLVAARMRNIQTFFAMTQVFLLPMFFLSGSLYPLGNLPTWLHVLTRIDPLTYVVDPMRRAVFAHLSISPLVRHTLSPGVTWGSWHVPTPLELAIVAVIGLAMLGVGIAQFHRTE